MTPEIALAFAILIAALVVFALERFPVDFVALGILATILVLGPVLRVHPNEAISGFSNPATITVLAMFILSGGVQRTGMINILARRAIRFAGEGEFLQLVTVMLIVGPISMVINNTAAVAMLIPMVIALAHEHRRPASKLLMPLSFFSQLAGVVTLIGTSTNILASALSEEKGFGAFGMFDFAGIGILIFLTGSAYILLAGRHLLPERRPETDVAERYHLREYLTELLVRENSPLLGKSLVESRFGRNLDIGVLEIIRDGQPLPFPFADVPLRAGDILFVRANTGQLLRLKDVEGIEIAREARYRHELTSGDEPGEGGMGLWEIVLGPNSDLIGIRLEDTNFRKRFNCIVIAIQKHGRLLREALGQVRLGFGDTLLLTGPRSAAERLRLEPGFILTGEVQQEHFRSEKIPAALLIVFGVVLVAAAGVPILVTSIVGCVLMVLTRCMTLRELHASIRWDVIFLLAGVIPLGLALERTGGAELLADLAAAAAPYVPPIVVLALFYFSTMVLTELISNNAAVVVMIPVAGATALNLGLDPKALFLAVMFAASTSFSTPVGYQTNTMVYGPGGYRFLDFLRVGGPLNLLLAVVTPLYIYWIWGL